MEWWHTGSQSHQLTVTLHLKKPPLMPWKISLLGKQTVDTPLFTHLKIKIHWQPFPHCDLLKKMCFMKNDDREDKTLEKPRTNGWKHLRSQSQDGGPDDGVGCPVL